MPHLPDLEAWAIFAKIAELGTFSGAADELALSKATVSKAVSRLEARLGSLLFHRTSRRLSLTESGRASLERARRILAEGEAVEEEATAQSAEPRGLVRITAPVAFGARHVAPLLPDLLDRYPKLRVELHLSDAFVDIVGYGFDLALRITSLKDSSLRARRLCGVPRPLTGSPAYWERHGRPTHPRELEHHVGLLYSNISPPDVWTFHHAQEGDVSVRIPGRMISNDAEALMPALLGGHGIMPLPSFYVQEYLADGRLEAALDDWAMPTVGLHIVTPPGTLRPQRVTLMIDFLARMLSMAPWATLVPPEN